MIKLRLDGFLKRDGENIAVVLVAGILRGDCGRVRDILANYPGDFTAHIKCEELIQLGEACKNHEQGEAHDAAASLDMGKLAENMNDSMNKLAIMGNLKGGKNE